MGISFYRELNNTLKELGASFTLQTQALLNASASLDERLRELIAEKQKNDAALAKTIAGSIENATARLEAVEAAFEKSALLIKESCENMPNLKVPPQIKMNMINNMAVEFEKLRKTLVDRVQGGGNTAIEKLESINETLENNISKTFASIDETLKLNTEKLNASYERFSEICRVIK